MATFDTHKVVKGLIDAGFSEAQAEAVVGAVGEGRDDTATKSDLRELELRLTLRMGAMLFAASGIVVALIKLL